jgi:hypothetical protein
MYESSLKPSFIKTILKQISIHSSNSERECDVEPLKTNMSRFQHLEVLLSNSNASFYCHSQTTTTIEEDKS